MNLKQQALREVEELLQHCTPEELNRLNLSTLDGNSIDGHCIYGQLTGSPDSERAIELICKSATYLIGNGVENDGQELPISALGKLLDNYHGGVTLDFEKKELDYDDTDTSKEVFEDVLMVDPKQRTLYFISPLERWLPFINDEEDVRLPKLAALQNALAQVPVAA